MQTGFMAKTVQTAIDEVLLYRMQLYVWCSCCRIGAIIVQNRVLVDALAQALVHC
jgi:hypothetical protein